MEIERNNIDSNEYQTNYDLAYNDLKKMLFELEDALKKFKKATYSETFNEYYLKYKYILDAIDKAYYLTDNKQDLLNSISENLVNKVYEKVNQGKNKHVQDNTLVDYNLQLVAYTLPLIQYSRFESSKPLAEAILAEWKKKFPKTNLGLAEFEEINAGFKNRFCYISTAVCQSLNKPDDCYELQLLRNYRDTFLQKQTDGEEVIAKYYNLAPTIVNHINKQENSIEVYRYIYEKYIKKCISLIEVNKNEKCRELYSNMLGELYKKYFFK